LLFFCQISNVQKPGWLMTSSGIILNPNQYLEDYCISMGIPGPGIPIDYHNPSGNPLLGGFWEFQTLAGLFSRITALEFYRWRPSLSNGKTT
jgi:hypothetical protein